MEWGENGSGVVSSIGFIRLLAVVRSLLADNFLIPPSLCTHLKHLRDFPGSFKKWQRSRD